MMMSNMTEEFLTCCFAANSQDLAKRPINFENCRKSNDDFKIYF